MEGISILLIVLAACLYFIPTIVGWNTKSQTGILIVNLFFGWTLLGWVIALVWAVASPRETLMVAAYTCKKCGFKKEFEQKLKIYKCPQCEEENIV
jgi:hypothetical protein